MTLGECHTATGKLAGAAEGLLPGRPGWAPTETQGGDTGSGVQAAGSPRSLQCCFGPRGKDQASHSTSALIPLATSSPRTKRGIRGSRRTAGKASAGNCLLVLCHAHHMTPSSLPPEKKRGRSGPPPPHPELRARTGRVTTPWAAGLCSSHHVLPVGGQVRPTPKGFKHRSPKSARARPRAFQHPGPAQVQEACGSNRLFCCATWRGTRRGLGVVTRPRPREARQLLGEAALSVDPTEALCRLDAGPRGADAGRVRDVLRPPGRGQAAP